MIFARRVGNRGRRKYGGKFFIIIPFVITYRQAFHHLGVIQGPILELVEAATAAGAAPADSVTTARTLAGEGFAEARDLADLAVRVRDFEVPYEAEAINRCLDDVRAALSELE